MLNRKNLWRRIEKPMEKDRIDKYILHGMAFHTSGPLQQCFPTFFQPRHTYLEPLTRRHTISVFRGFTGSYPQMNFYC